MGTMATSLLLELLIIVTILHCCLVSSVIATASLWPGKIEKHATLFQL